MPNLLSYANREPEGLLLGFKLKLLTIGFLLDLHSLDLHCECKQKNSINRFGLAYRQNQVVEHLESVLPKENSLKKIPVERAANRDVLR